MSTTKGQFGTTTALTITLTSLANAAARESTAIDNTTNLFLDAMLYVSVKLTAGTPAAGAGVDVYAYASVDETNYTDNATGADAALTMRSTPNLILLGRIMTSAAGALTWKQMFVSIAGAFGGILPPKWGIVIDNQSGFALDSSGNALSYRGITAQAV